MPTPDPIRPSPPADEDLHAIIDHLAHALRSHNPDAKEGVVRGRQPPSYRRLDCDGRALAYVRPRAQRKRGVRIDLSGLWVRPGPCPLDIPGRTGSASLLVRTIAEAETAARYLAAAVVYTRALLEAEAATGAPSIGGGRAGPRRRRAGAAARGPRRRSASHVDDPARPA